MTVALRLLGPGDASVLGRVAPDVFDEPVVPHRAAAVLAAPGHLLAVALDGDLVVGQCQAMIHLRPDRPPELYIDNLGVAPAWHRQGIGRALLGLVMADARARGCEGAWVGTEPDNGPANALYRALGSLSDPFVLHLFSLSADPPQDPA